MQETFISRSGQYCPPSGRYWPSSSVYIDPARVVSISVAVGDGAAISLPYSGGGTTLPVGDGDLRLCRFGGGISGL